MSKIILAIPEEGEDWSTVSVEIMVSIEDPYSFRDDLTDLTNTSMKSIMPTTLPKWAALIASSRRENTGDRPACGISTGWKAPGLPF